MHTAPRQHLSVVLELGKKRVFASVLEWPGWVRSGRDKSEAIESLLRYAPRYSEIMHIAQLPFIVPVSIELFTVIEELYGDSTTDFGAPGTAASAEAEPLNHSDLTRYMKILNACWVAFADALSSSEGKTLRTGPRGGGRSAVKIADHVIDSHFGYLRQIYWRNKQEHSDNVFTMIDTIKKIDSQAVSFAASDSMPETGPRGGQLWSPRYFVRRSAWHILDHTWEIEDRLT